MKAGSYPVIILIAAFTVLCSGPAAGRQFVSSGSYTDREGTTHTWNITGQHTLNWDGSPYIPAGVVFHSRYASIDQTEENWESDVQNLEALKANGNTDLLLPAGGPISWTSPSAWQKLLDYLDSNGFTYGIELSDGPSEGVSGMIVRPSRYRLPNISMDGDYSFGARDAHGGVFILCAPRDGSVIRSGELKVDDGRMIASVTIGRGTGYILLAYPEVDLSGMEDSLPDVWGGFDDYRDRLLSFFSDVKPGRGVRFLLNPMSGNFGLTGEFVNLVPSSPAFQLEFEAWLAKKYQTVGSLCVAWGIAAQRVSTFGEASRLLPLWYDGKGSPNLYDIATGATHPVDVGTSIIWSDILQFRDASIQYYMNAIAHILKREVADVPVVYRARSFQRVYANARQQGGFDGLAAVARGVGEHLALGEAAWALALAKESDCTTWLISSSVRPSERSYPSKAAMHTDLEFLKEIGVKGLYASGVQAPPEVREGSDLLAAPEQLDWLIEFGQQMAEAANFEPRTVSFPEQADTAASIARLADGAWWLPTNRAGESLSLGGGVIGYAIKGENRICLWTSDGSPQKITFSLRRGQEPKILYPAEAVNRAVLKGEMLEVHLDGSPVVLSGIDMDRIVPVETVEQEISELERAYASVQKADRQSPATKDALDRARKVLKNGQTAAAYDIARAELTRLQAVTGGYVWIEAEHASEHNMDGIAAIRGASNGRYLTLNTGEDAPMAPYGATYQFNIPKDATYDIYVAGSRLGEGSSAVTYSIDNGPWQAPTGGILGDTYGPSFGWFKIGSAELTSGRHTLSFNIIGRRRSDSKYSFALDAILITPWPFTPDGINRPEPLY